jgi:hypothetical protein
MAPWCFHVLYPPFDVENIMGYPNDVPPNWRDKIPKFDIFSFENLAKKFRSAHQYLQVALKVRT